MNVRTYERPPQTTDHKPHIHRLHSCSHNFLLLNRQVCIPSTTYSIYDTEATAKIEKSK